MEELESALREKNIIKITEIIESSTFPKGLKTEVLPVLATFLIQKSGYSTSPQTIAWLKAMVDECPKVVREVSENFGECLERMKERCPKIDKLLMAKGKLSLFCVVRAEAPDMSTATPEHLNENSDDESDENNYQQFSVKNI